jgi:hypothetical protein
MAKSIATVGVLFQKLRWPGFQIILRQLSWMVTGQILCEGVYPTWLLLKYPVSTNMPGSLNLNPNETKLIKIFTHLHSLIKKKLMFMYSIYIVSIRTKMNKQQR